MPTFLVTPKMNDALAARIEASVTGEKSADPNVKRRRMRRFTAIARVVLVVGLTWGLWSGFGAWRQNKIDTERARTELLGRVQAEAASLREGDKNTAGHVEAWLLRAAGPWDGDLVADEVKTTGLAAMLEQRTAIYVRGSIDAFAKPSAIPGAAGASVKDSLLYCLVDPPATRAESAVLDKVRTSYGTASAVEAQTTNVRRLAELLAGMPFLEPKWADAVRWAPDLDAIARLRREFDRAPIAHAKQAAHASLLLVAVDEPGTGTGPTELDGERAHPIRLVLGDLETDKPLLRARKVVDPSWISVGRRPHYARGIDACAFAFDVLEDAKKK